MHGGSISHTQQVTSKAKEKKKRKLLSWYIPVIKKINQVFGFLTYRRAKDLAILLLHSKQASLDN